MVALLTARASKLGTNSRYFPTLSSKPRPALELARARLRAGCVGGLAIKWPQGYGRIKEVVTRSGARRRYVIPCYRYGDREAHCEAAEEAAACILLDACPGIEFQEQPFRLEFPWLGEIHQHVPDLLVASPGRYELWECKREAEAGNFWIRKRAEHLRTLLAPTQVGYRVVTGREVFAGHCLENARMLRRFATQWVSPSIASELALQVRFAGVLTLDQARKRLAGEVDIGDILALIYRGTICTDLNVRLTEKSVIHLPERNERLPWVWQLFDAAST